MFGHHGNLHYKANLLLEQVLFWVKGHRSKLQGLLHSLHIPADGSNVPQVGLIKSSKEEQSETNRKLRCMFHHTCNAVGMPSFTKACKICGLIMILIVVFTVMKMSVFGSSSGPALLQKRSGDCWCSLSCDEAPELMKHDSVHVQIEHHSETVHDGIYTVSSLYEKGRCSVVVQDCLQWGTQFTLTIFDNKKPVPDLLYKKADLKSECETEKPPEERSGADRNSSNTLLILMIIFILHFSQRIVIYYHIF